jgi:periplasmic protein CpxP/Spy
MISVFTSSMSAVLKPLLLASLLAGAAFSALAQTPPAGPMSGPGREHRGMMHRGPMDPAKMQAMVAKRQAALKETLKITAAQEGAWNAFTSIMQPSADMHKRRMEMRAEIQKLTTPERIDKMRALRTERDAEMDKRANATKTFYAALSPEQQKVFDSRPMRGADGRGHEHGRGHGRRHG